MCVCDPCVRTPWCGRGSCQWPEPYKSPLLENLPNCDPERVTRLEYVARTAILAAYSHLEGETTPEYLYAELDRLEHLLDGELTDSDLERITGGKTALGIVGVSLTGVSIWQRWRDRKRNTNTKG
jgi:hypothetical protein